MADEVVLAEVAGAFQLGQPDAPSYVDRGVSGEVYRVTTRVGTWALKRLFQEPDLEQVEIETRVQEAASAVGVVSPRPMRTTDGQYVAVVRDAHWRVNEWHDASPAESLPVDVERVAEAGAVLVAVHSLRFEPTRSMFPWLTTPPSVTAWENLRARVRELAPPWGQRFDELYPELLRLSDFAHSVAFRDPVLGHCDFAPANVGVATDHLVVFDWERASAIPPLQELGYALWHWSGLGAAEETAPAFLRGYRSRSSDAIEVDMCTFGSAAASWLNFFRSQANVNGGQTAPMLKRPMTVDSVQALVDLVR